MKSGGEGYQLIVSAAQCETMAAYKFIVRSEGEKAFVSKENNSNEYTGTLAVSDPSVPRFCKYYPKLVNIMCRLVFKFASMSTKSYGIIDLQRGHPYNICNKRVNCNNTFIFKGVF